LVIKIIEDSKIASFIPENIRKEAIVVFDEAHNIDDVCIEVNTVKVNKLILE
jgi:DNA excision repair protein ERCC-2